MLSYFLTHSFDSWLWIPLSVHWMEEWSNNKLNIWKYVKWSWRCMTMQGLEVVPPNLSTHIFMWMHGFCCVSDRADMQQGAEGERMSPGDPIYTHEVIQTAGSCLNGEENKCLKYANIECQGFGVTDLQMFWYSDLQLSSQVCYKDFFIRLLHRALKEIFCSYYFSTWYSIGLSS